MTEPSPTTLPAAPAGVPDRSAAGPDTAAAPGGAPVGAPATGQLPPDPAAYDSPRAVLARARGLSAPYIAGGVDPDPEEGVRQDRYYGRLLILMVAAVVAMGFVLGLIANIIAALGG